jgi:hypothetical protein
MLSFSINIVFNFESKCPDTKVKYSFYRKCLRENLGIKFGRPEIDSCDTCELLTNKIKSKTLNATARKAAETELMIYSRRIKKF